MISTLLAYLAYSSSLYSLICGADCFFFFRYFFLPIKITPEQRVTGNASEGGGDGEEEGTGVVEDAVFGKDIYKDNKFYLDNTKLGKQTIKAAIYYNDQSQNTALNIIILNSESPKIYAFKIINEYPHDITSYTQGLEFFKGKLYESTGQRGKSKLRKVNYKTGEVLKNIDLSKAYFGEGLTILHNNLYQLTWQSGTGFVYDPVTFEKKSSFKYGKSKEGWGLCNDGNSIYKSDGTEKLGYQTWKEISISE